MSSDHAWFTVEELTAAIEARILAKLEKELIGDWGKQFETKRDK